MRVYPKESDRYLINLGKGWILYRSFAHASEATWAKASVGYARFNWSDIHPAERTFNWELKTERQRTGIFFRIWPDSIAISAVPFPRCRP